MQRVLRKKHTDLLFSLFLLVLLAFSVTHMAVISEGVFSALTLCVLNYFLARLKSLLSHKTKKGL